MFAGPFASGGKRKPGLGGVSITSLNVNLLTRARKAVSGLRRRGFRDYYALKGASLRFNIQLSTEAQLRLRLFFKQAVPHLPDSAAASDVLHASALEHPNVVFKVAPPIKQTFHRNGPRQVVLQHLS